MLRLNECFASIQGESTHAGRKCFFIRLSGCNLSCSYCDTLYAADPASGREVSVDELLKAALGSNLKLVEITGGEPLCQSETPQLCQALLDNGFEVLMETNGSLSIAPLPVEVRKILDCKLPSSGMSDRNFAGNYSLLQPHDEVKFVISDRNDFEYACNAIRKYRIFEYTSHLIASPVWGKVSFEDLAAMVIGSDLPWRMQLQMHKLIWGDRQGV